MKIFFTWQETVKYLGRSWYISDFPYPVGNIPVVSFPLNTTLFNASYWASLRESSAFPNFSKAKSNAEWNCRCHFQLTSRRRSQTGTMIRWLFQSVRFPSMAKGNAGSGNEIDFLNYPTAIPTAGNTQVHWCQTSMQRHFRSANQSIFRLDALIGTFRSDYDYEY